MHLCESSDCILVAQHGLPYVPFALFIGARSGIAISDFKISLVFLYFFMLTIFAIMHQKEDASVWHSTVCDFPWFETKQCIRSAPNSPMMSRFVKSKSPSLVAPKPRRAPPPPIFIHGRAGLSSRVEIEHFTDIASLEEQPLPPPPMVPPQAALSFYPQHVQSSIQSHSGPTTYQNNTYYSSDRGASPPPIRNWPRPIVADASSDRPVSERAAQKRRAPEVPNRSGSDAFTRAPPPPPLNLERTTTKDSATSSAQDSPSRSRPTGPRTRSGSSTFVRPRPPPLDLTRNGSTPNVRR